jgi:hypothetical protein
VDTAEHSEDGQALQLSLLLELALQEIEAQLIRQNTEGPLIDEIIDALRSLAYASPSQKQ